jgi:hypothetical protein
MPVIRLDEIWLASPTDSLLATVALLHYEIGKTTVRMLLALMDCRVQWTFG